MREGNLGFVLMAKAWIETNRNDLYFFLRAQQNLRKYWFILLMRHSPEEIVNKYSSLLWNRKQCIELIDHVDCIISIQYKHLLAKCKFEQKRICLCCWCRIVIGMKTFFFFWIQSQFKFNDVQTFYHGDSDWSLTSLAFFFVTKSFDNICLI